MPTHHAEASVFLTDEALQALAEQREECGCRASLVFCDPATGGPFTARIQWLRRLCVRAGVERFGHHGIRHLCASILAARGVPLVEVQRHLRHENLTTTQRYIHQLQKSPAVLSALAGLRDDRPTKGPQAKGKAPTEAP